MKESCLAKEVSQIGLSYDSVSARETEKEAPVKAIQNVENGKEAVQETTSTEIVSEEIISSHIGNVEVEKEENGWITPKSSCNPGYRGKELKFGQVSILSNAYSG